MRMSDENKKNLKVYKTYYTGECFIDITLLIKIFVLKLIA